MTIGADLAAVPFEHAAACAPQPVAIACARVIAARGPAERLDALLRCGEVLTRYLVALSLGSFAARDELAAPVPASVIEIKGKANLAWGSFLGIVQGVAGSKANHPLRPILRPCFSGKPPDGAPVNRALVALLELRNRLGHSLAGLAPGSVLSVLRDDQPDRLVAQALDHLAPVLSLPLFLVEEQRIRQRRIFARRLLLMGASTDPIPEEIELDGALDRDGILYVGIDRGALSVHPLAIWDLSERTRAHALYLLDGIEWSKSAEFLSADFKSVHIEDESHGGPDISHDLPGRLAGDPLSIEEVRLADGRSFAREWQDRRHELELATAMRGIPIPWASLDPATLRWYARALAPEEANRPPAEVVRNHLCFGATHLTPEDLRQLTLLLGTEENIRREIRRAVLDMRVRSTPGASRWDERIESTRNVLESLRAAVDGFGRHVHLENAALDDLRATTGTADYLAMREALVNLFVHQDYGNQGMAAQVELEPDRATFFNGGHALVDDTALVEGGRSQARNPLIARALKLIGFAEIAGSGLRAVQHAWRESGRRPPTFRSDREGGTFTLMLDWRPIPVVTDAFWQRRLGARLSPDQARALVLAAETDGVDAAHIASANGSRMEDARLLLSSLVTQGLVDARDDRWFIREDLRSVAEEARTAPDDSSS